MNIIAVLPQEVGLPLAQQQPTLGAQCTLPQTIGLQAVPDDREDSEPRRSRQKRTCAMTWYSEAVNSGQGKTTAMLPPSPRRRRSARTAQRNIDTAQARAAEIAAVASASHVDSEGALTVDLTPGLRTRSQTRATVQFSPTAQVCSHDTGHDTVSTVGPATPSPRVVGRAPLWQQRQESTFNMMSDFQPSECPNEENGGQLVPNPNARSEPPSALCSPREDPTGAHLNALQVSEWPSSLGKRYAIALDVCSSAQHLLSGSQDLTPIKKPFMQDGPTGLHDFPAAEALLSPALRAVCSGLDLSRLDGDALALSPINHGLSPLTLGLTDLPSPLTALPALVSPCPDSLQVCSSVSLCLRVYCRVQMCYDQ